MKKTIKKNQVNKIKKYNYLLVAIFVLLSGFWVYRSIAVPSYINVVMTSNKVNTAKSLGGKTVGPTAGDAATIKSGKSTTVRVQDLHVASAQKPSLGGGAGSSTANNGVGTSTTNKPGDPPPVPAKTTVAGGASNGTLFNCTSGKCVQVKDSNVVRDFINDVVVDYRLGNIDKNATGIGGKPANNTPLDGSGSSVGSMGSVDSGNPKLGGRSLKGQGDSDGPRSDLFTCKDGECLYTGPALTDEQESHLKIKLDSLANADLGSTPTSDKTDPTSNTPVVPPNPAKSQCEAKGYRFVDVAGVDKDSCVNPLSTSCGDLGQNINGICYYPGDQIPNSDRIVCDWTNPANNTGRRYSFNSNNCPERSNPNSSHAPSSKGDCSGNAGWWDGTKCNVPGLTPLDGSSGTLIVCKGVEAGGKLPKYNYAYVSTVAECPWAQEQIRSTCKDVIDPVTKECRKRTPDEQKKYCKDTKQTYDSVSGKCVPPGTESITPDTQAKICANQGKRYSPPVPGCSGDFADPSITLPNDEHNDILPGNVEANGSVQTADKANCNLWEIITGTCKKTSSSPSTTTPLSPDERDEINNASISDSSATDSPKCSIIATMFGCKNRTTSDTTAPNSMNKPTNSALEVNQGGGGVFTDDQTVTNNGIQAQIEDLVTKVQEYLKGIISPQTLPGSELPINHDQGIRSQ